MEKKKTPGIWGATRRLVNFKYKDGNNMVGHINSFQGIVNKLVAMKINIDG